VRNALIIAGFALLILFLYAQLVRRTSMFFPAKFPVGNWDTSPLPVKPEDVEIISADGVRLHAWFFQAGQPTLIWCHGNAGNITERAPMAAELAQRGISVLLFDWRGYGKSAGTPTESGLFRDALAAYDYVLYRPLPLGLFAPFALRTTHWLNQAGVPVLVMHGKRDQVIPFSLGMDLYNGLHVPKELLVCENAGHCEIPNTEPERYYQTIVRFLRAQGQVANAPVS
jgi:fermentation-respiration switch protein FrsA (DUF1100 family)